MVGRPYDIPIEVRIILRHKGVMLLANLLDQIINTRTM